MITLFSFSLGMDQEDFAQHQLWRFCLAFARLMILQS
jgi:hypothetical protein